MYFKITASHNDFTESKNCYVVTKQDGDNNFKMNDVNVCKQDLV